MKRWDELHSYRSALRDSACWAPDRARRHGDLPTNLLPRQTAFMQQTGVAFVPVVSSDEAGASFVGCVYFHLLEDVLNEFEELAAHRLATPNSNPNPSPSPNPNPNTDTNTNQAGAGGPVGPTRSSSRCH